MIQVVECHFEIIFCFFTNQNEFKVTYEPLKHRFLDFNQVAFWDGQEEENEFPLPGDHLKYRFLDLTKPQFWACQEAENDL